MRLHRALLVGALSAAWIAPSFAAVSFPADGVLVYSSLCSGEEDDGGSKIVLIRDATGIAVVYWRSEGAILAPLLAFGPDVKLDERAGSIWLHFVDPEIGPGAGTYTLVGVISEDELELDSNIEGAIRLPRVHTEVARLPKCRSDK